MQQILCGLFTGNRWCQCEINQILESKIDNLIIWKDNLESLYSHKTQHYSRSILLLILINLSVAVTLSVLMDYSVLPHEAFICRFHLSTKALAGGFVKLE